MHEQIIDKHNIYFGHGSQWFWSSEIGLIHDFNYVSVNKINKILQDMNFPQN